MRREVSAVMKALDSEHDSLEDAAKAAIEAYEEVNRSRDQWIVVAKPLRNGPLVGVGPWTTRNQAEKASESFVSAHRDSNEGTGMAVVKMHHTEWIKKLNG